MSYKCKPLPVQRINAPDDYKHAPQEIEVYGPYSRYRRCGITAPHYPERATYARVTLDDQEDYSMIYVFEDGRLWPSTDWRMFYAAAGVTPAQAEKGGGE